jgi:hypothetical protein
VKTTITRKELIYKFRRLGFEGPFSGGKHQFMKKGEMKAARILFVDICTLLHHHGVGISENIARLCDFMGDVDWRDENNGKKVVRSRVEKLLVENELL